MTAIRQSQRILYCARIEVVAFFLRIVFKALTSAMLLRSQGESSKKSLHGSYTLQECPSTYQLRTVDTRSVDVIFTLLPWVRNTTLQFPHTLSQGH